MVDSRIGILVKRKVLQKSPLKIKKATSSFTKLHVESGHTADYEAFKNLNLSQQIKDSSLLWPPIV